MFLLRWLKMCFLALPLVVASVFLGVICRQMGAAHPLFLAPSRALWVLLLRLLLALGGMAISAGIVAALFRPIAVACATYALSALALFLAWGLSVHAATLSLTYLVAAVVYAVMVQRDLAARTRFSVSALSRGQFGLLIILLAIAVGSFLISYNHYIAQYGLAIPQTYATEFSERLAYRLASALPQVVREQVQLGIQGHAEQLLTEELARVAKPVERYVPYVAALVLFLPLLAIVYFLSWLPMLFLWCIFPLLRVLRITRLVRAAIEVERLIIA
jgi:hypothetical protein